MWISLLIQFMTWQMLDSYFCNIRHIMYIISYFSNFLLWEILTSSVSYTCSFQTFCMDSYNFQPAQIWPCFRISYFYDIIFLLYCWHDLTFRWSILLQWYHFLTIGITWSYFLITNSYHTRTISYPVLDQFLPVQNTFLTRKVRVGRTNCRTQRDFIHRHGG